MRKLILVDVDGVLLNWIDSFSEWMDDSGYEVDDNHSHSYDIEDRYDMTKKEANSLIKTFNESANIGFLNPYKDAKEYVDILHRKHGYCFHAITAFGTDINARKLRTMNLHNLFGETAIQHIEFVGIRQSKMSALVRYANSNYFWIEDTLVHAISGAKLKLQPLLMNHPHNTDLTGSENYDIETITSWSDFYTRYIK